MHYCFLTIATLDNAGLMRARNLGRALIRKGVRVSYVVDDHPVNRDPAIVDPAARIEFTTDPRRPGQFARRRRLIKRLAPDFVEVLNPHVKTLLPLTGLPRVKVVAMWDEPAIVKRLAPARALLERVSARWLVSRAYQSFAATRTLVEELERRYGIHAVYMPHAAYLPEYPPVTTPYERPTAAYMGNLYSLWDHDVIFEAARLLALQGKKPPIAIMGDGPDMPKWKAFVERHQLDNVRLLGHTTGVELWRHLRYAHVLLFPIRHTLANLTRCPSKTFAYAQAMRPTITSRVGEVAEVLQGKATYVDSTPQAFAEAIDRAFDAQVLPDVNYHVERLNWDDHAAFLLETLGASGSRDKE